jgi:diacylglycerol kinase (ATP)
LDEGLDKFKLFKNFKKVKLIVGCTTNLHFFILGGDGTIGSILTHTSEQSFKNELKAKMSVAVLPLGTGNDLSRTLGWGPTFTSPDVSSIIKSVGSIADEILLDQWDVIIQEGKTSRTMKMYNYVGVGLDAKVALSFHNMRKKYPYLFKSRVFYNIHLSHFRSEINYSILSLVQSISSLERN